MAQENEKQVVAPLDLQAIKERVSKASVGPWKFNPEDTENYAAITGPGGELNVVCFFEGGAPSADDAEFMAYARNDIPALVAEVERLRNGLQAIDEVDEGSFAESYNRVISIVERLLEGRPYDDLLKDDDETDAK